MLIQQVLTRLQNLMQAAYGQTSDYADYDYLTKYIAIVNDDIAAELDGLDLHFDTQVVVLTAVPANTTSLSGYQVQGGPLGCLIFPNSTDGSSPIERRVSGQNDLAWEPVAQVGKVEDTNTATGNTGQIISDSTAVDSWEWRGGIIILSPCSVIVDLRIRGDFIPSLADNDAAPFIHGLVNILAYKAAGLVSALGPQNAQMVASMQMMYDKALEDFESRLSKSKHGQVIRLGGRRTQFPGIAGTFNVPIVG